MLQLLGSSPCGRASATLTQGSNGLASTPGGHELEFLLSSAERVRVCTRLPVSLARKGHGLLVAWRLVQGELPARPIRCLLFLDFLARLCVWAGNGLVSRSHLLLFVSTEGQCLALRNRSATDQWTHWGLNPRAFRMRSGCDTTTPCPPGVTEQYASEAPCALCARVHLSAREHVRMCVRVRMCVCLHARMHACVRGRAHARTHVRAHACARVRAHVRVHAHAHVRAHACTHVRAHLRARACLQVGTSSSFC